MKSYQITTPKPTARCKAYAALLPILEEPGIDPDALAEARTHLATCAYCQQQQAAYRRLETAASQHLGPPTIPHYQTAEIMHDLLGEPVTAPRETNSSSTRLATRQPGSVLQRVSSLAPVPSSPRRAASRGPHVVSWVSTLAAVLVIAFSLTALIASHLSTVGKPLATGPDQPVPGPYLSVVTADARSRAFIYALDPKTGAVRWSAQMPNTVIVNQEVVEQGVLYAAVDDFSRITPGQGTSAATHSNTPDQSAIYAFRTSDGKRLWMTLINSVINSFVVVDGIVYVGTAAGEVFALHASNGSVKWRLSVGAQADVKQVANSVLYVRVFGTAAPDKLLALNTGDGSTKWNFPLHGDYADINVLNTVIAVVDLATVVGKDGGSTTSRSLTVLNASDGSVKWRYQGNPANVGDVLAGQGIAYVALLGGSGKERPEATLQALNLSDGSLRWQKSYPSFTLLPHLGNGKAYVTVNQTTLLALNAQDGSEAWHAQGGAPFHVDGLIGSTLYAQAGTGLAAFNADSGVAQWNVQFAGNLIQGTSNQTVYGLITTLTFTPGKLSSQAAQVVALDGTTGKELWLKTFTNFAPVTLAVG